MRSVHACKPKTSLSEAPLTPIPPEILDQFVRQGPLSPEELDAAVRRFKKAIIEHALGGELTHHLGDPAGGTKPDDTTSHRNGTGGKTVLTDDGPLPIEVPRDREGTFEPRLVAKHERRFTGFDDKVPALYARGMTVREIQGFLLDMDGVEVSPDLISTVTERGPWDRKFPMVVASWRRAWTYIIPFFAFPAEVRRLIYTTNSLERVHAQLRKIIKARGHFPNDDAATKLTWLALRNITAKWERTAYSWRPAMNPFAILFADRFSPFTT